MTTTTSDTFSLEDLQRDIGDDITVSAVRAPPKPQAVRGLKPMPKGNDAALDDLPVISEEVDLAKGWMKYHRLELVKSADKVRELVDRALQVGYVALDTETQGLDTRIEYRKDGSPYTRHSIIGYCIGLEGEGYYIPVRHKAESKHDGSPNVDSVEQAEAEITRLCLAAQPVLKEGVRDILGAKEKDFEVPPRVVIEFWHAKFDQEMLYPITGIDIWNPYSFDDGMLMVYTLDSEADQGLKENARDRLKPVADPKTGELHPYEMIEYEELFVKGTKKSQRKLERLVPREEGEGHNVVLYGCSDGICTNLLCGQLRPQVKAKANFASFYNLEKQVTQVVRIIERTRVLINKGEIASLLQEADDELLACEKEIKRLAKALGFGDEFNPSSSAQLADLLFGPKGVWKGEKPEKTKEGQYKTDEKTIENFTKDPKAPEVFTLVLKHRRINKVRGTYLQNLANNTDELDQLRLNFRPTGAATGRFTAPKGDPEHGYGGIPIQGIPARDDPKKPKVAHSLRRMFIARAGYVVVKVDYASQELRIAASTSGEPKWIAEYEKEAETGISADLHFLTAQAFYPGLTRDSPENEIKIKRGAGKCVHPDTLVSTTGGYAPLGMVAAFPEAPDTFLPIPDGVEIDGRPVAQSYNGGVKPLVHVVARRGVVTCTTQHRFLTADGRFVAAGDLQKGDRLADPDFGHLDGGGPVTLSLKMWKGVPAASYAVDANLCYLAGAFLGDGTVCASGARITHGHVDKLDAFDEPYSGWQASLLDACRRAGIDAEPGSDSVYLGSRVTTRFLSGLSLVEWRPGTADGRMKTLRVPVWVRALGEEGFLSFLGGLVDTDGSVSHTHRSIEITTKDFVFGGQLATLAQAAGLSLSCEATFNKTYKRHYLRLRFSVESSWLLASYLRYGAKRVRLAPPTRVGVRDVNDVLAVIPAGEGPCVDVTMATEEHVYRANGLVTHNTANFALIYGGGVGAVQRATGCDKVEGARMKAAFDASVPVFSKWVKGQKEYVKKHHGVVTAFKRFISIPDANLNREEVIRRLRAAEKRKKRLTDEQANELKFSEQLVEQEVSKGRASAERKATNYPIQGCLSLQSPVLTRRGPRSVGALLSKPSFEVWTGSTWALATVLDMGPWERAEIGLSDGTLIECDTRHKLLIVSDAGYAWTEYSELTQGMAVATALCVPMEFETPPELPPLRQARGKQALGLVPSLIAESWYWIGRYVGDGHLHKDGVTWTFGEHERDAIERCKRFWAELGANPVEECIVHRPAVKESTRFRVTVWSVDIHDWLLDLGLKDGVTAHTKRCPARIFAESLENRKAFLCGVMESDGHKPALPTKIDGVWDVKRRGNPYAVHLCQRPLLVDLKRIFRTVGVESVIRGPYQSGLAKDGKPTSSYRLDLNRRMFEHHIMGRPVRLPKPHDQFAPRFLVEELLATGPYERTAFGGNESAYTLYLRLKSGGRVSVYTLVMLCDLLGVKLSQPIYGYARLTEKRALGRVENTYTLSVQDPLHRFDSDGVITKNSGADILKISLVLLLREFLLRGWLRNGGDDSVRIIMTVHDEIVFEIREERVAEAVPVITQLMEHPYRLAKWKVPLVAEVELGSSWAAKLKWASILKGETPRPPYLEGVEINPRAPVLVLGGVTAPTSPLEPKTLPTAAPVAAVPAALPDVSPVSERPPSGPEYEPEAPADVPSEPSRARVEPNGFHRRRVASFKLNRLHVDRKTAVAVAGAMAAAKIEGIRLEQPHREMLVEFVTEVEGQRVLLYAADEGYRVHVQELEVNLRRRDLLDSVEEREELVAHA